MLIFCICWRKNSGEEIHYGYFDSLQKAQNKLAEIAFNGYNIATVNKQFELWSFYTDDTENAEKWFIKKIEVM